MRTVLGMGVLLLAVLGAAVWLWLRGPAPTPIEQSASVEHRVIDDVREPSTAAAGLPDADERVALPTPAKTFVSVDDDGVLVADPVRDGLSVLLIDEARRPLAGRSIDVRWRKGWGDYGNDVGTTDAQGRFATTVANSEMIEGVAVDDDRVGALESWFDFCPSAHDPRTVVCVCPTLHPLRLRVVDQRGGVVSGASVKFASGELDAAAREFVLGVDFERDADERGELLLHVPAGPLELVARAEGYDELYRLSLPVPVGGRAAVMHLFDPSDVREVAVTVVGDGDPAVLAKLRLGAWTRTLPDLAGLEPQGVDIQQRKFALRRVDGPADGRVRFVAELPPQPVQIRVSCRGYRGQGRVEPRASSVTIELQPVPAKDPVAKRPRTRLRCELLDDEDQPCGGTVMVCRSPDLVFAQRHEVSVADPWVEVEPGGKACVVAWLVGLPPAMVGPIDLEPGEQEVVLRFAAPLEIRGRIVDERGDPVRSRVYLQRPAGPLASLGVDVPEVLVHVANGDSTVARADGSFAFRTCGRGRHVLRVLPKQAAWGARVEVMAGEQDVSLQLGEGLGSFARIQGRVTLVSTGEPVQARLRWRRDGARGTAVTSTVYSGVDGRYVAEVPPGPLSLEVAAKDCALLQVAEASFEIGLQTRNVGLQPTEPLFVRVRAPDGSVPDVRIRAFDPDGRARPFLLRSGEVDGELAEVDGNGRATLLGLPLAPVTLRVSAPGNAARSVDVEVPARVPRDRDLEIVFDQ